MKKRREIPCLWLYTGWTIKHGTYIDIVHFWCEYILRVLMNYLQFKYSIILKSQENSLLMAQDYAATISLIGWRLHVIEAWQSGHFWTNISWFTSMSCLCSPSSKNRYLILAGLKGEGEKKTINLSEKKKKIMKDCLDKVILHLNDDKKHNLSYGCLPYLWVKVIIR